MDTSIHEEKRSVPRAFDRAASRYDLLTSLNPGYHRHLRLSASRVMQEVRAGGRVLDLCCGTGLSTEALAAVRPDVELVGLDASAGMLVEARSKVVLRGVHFVHGDATDPRAAGIEGRFDAILMAYGIRNVPHANLCLSNLRELLEPGGQICFHEYSVAGSRRARATWDAVTMGIVIPLGATVGGNADIYRYLRRSVHAFDSVPQFEQRLRAAGFDDVRTEPMDGWQRRVLHSFLARKASV